MDARFVIFTIHRHLSIYYSHLLRLGISEVECLKNRYERVAKELPPLALRHLLSLGYRSELIDKVYKSHHVSQGLLVPLTKQKLWRAF